MGKAFITDYIDNPSIEKDILGDVAQDPNDPEIEVLLVWHKDVNKEYLAQFKNLKGMVRYGVGTDNLDFEEANRRNLYICNTPDYGIDEVSDTTIAMIMNFTRGIQEHDIASKKIIDNSWQENINPKKRRSSELVVGVIGAGRIGSSVLIKAKSIGFETVFYDPYKEQGHDKVVSAYRCDTIDEFLQLTDIVSINAKLNNETNSLVNKDFISKMKENAYLINTARGGIVNEKDLKFALEHNIISGAALDVYDSESVLNEDLLVLPNLICTPHTGGNSHEAVVAMGLSAIEHLVRYRNKTK